MSTSTKFDWHYVSLPKLLKVGKQVLPEGEQDQLSLLSSGKADGGMLLMPVLACGSRDQSMHCLLCLWGEGQVHGRLEDAVKFVEANFPDCRFYVLLSDAKKTA